jgi:hypothetical protein
MTRTWPVLLGLLLLAAPAVVQAQFSYTTNADGITLTITGYSGPGGAVSIPAAINDLQVINIGENAFASGEFDENRSLTGVTIPFGVTNIGSGAFAYCVALSEVTIPSSVTSIGGGAFFGCGMTGVTIPGSVTSLGYEVFGDCALTSVSIPESVTNIGSAAFCECNNLGRVTIRGSVTSVESGLCNNCPSLTNVTILGGAINFGASAFAVCTNLGSVFIGGNAPTVGSYMFADDTNATVYYLPGTTGWGGFSANTGRPTVLWNPLIQTGDGSFGVRNNQFGFNITGTTNIPIVVEACANLASPVWVPLQTLTLTNGLFYFSDPQWTNYSGRYYRISSP